MGLKLNDGWFKLNFGPIFHFCPQNVAKAPLITLAVRHPKVSMCPSPISLLSLYMLGLGIKMTRYSAFIDISMIMVL